MRVPRLPTDVSASAAHLEVLARPAQSRLAQPTIACRVWPWMTVAGRGRACTTQGRLHAGNGRA